MTSPRTAIRSAPLVRSVPKFRLRTALIVPFVLQVIVIVVLVSYLYFQNEQKTVEDVATQLRQEIAVRVDQNIRSYLEIPHLVNQNNAVAIDLEQLDLQNLAGLEQYFWRQLQVFDTLTFAGIGFENRDNLGAERVDDGSLTLRVSTQSSNYDFATYSTDRLGNRVKLLHHKPDFDPRTRPWYRAAVAADQPVWSDIYPNTAGLTAYLGASMPFYKQGSLQGVLLTNINLSRIGSFLQSLKVGKTGQVMILERSGLLVATSTGEKPFRTVQKEFGAERVKAIDSSNAMTQATAQFLSQNLTANNGIDIQDAKLLEFSIKGQREFLQVSPFRDRFGLDWLIAVVIPQSDLTRQLSANTHSTLQLTLVASLLAIALGIIAAHYITRPILQVSQASKAIARGNLDQHVTSNFITEIETLAHSFNWMARQLQTSFVALKASEIQNRAIVEALPDLLFRVRKDGIYTDNPLGRNRIEELFSGERSLAGKSVYDSLPPPLAQRRMQAIQQVLETGELEIYEQQIVVRNQTIDEEVRIVKITDDEALVLVRDITDRKRIEDERKRQKELLEASVEERTVELANANAALKASEAELRGLFAAIDDVILVYDRQGICLKVASTKPNLLLQPSEKMIGQSAYDILPEAQARLRLESIQQVLETRQTINFEYSLLIGENSGESLSIPSEKQEVWFSANLSPLSEDTVIMVARDITERRHTEKALQASEAELRALFAAMTDVVMVKDRQGRYCKIAPTNSQNLLTSTVGLLGLTEHDILPKAQADRFVNHIQQVLQTQQTASIDYSLTIENREVWFTATVSPLAADTVVWVARDISDRKRVEDERRQAEIAQQEQLHLLQVILDALPFPVFYKDNQGIYLGCNQAFLIYRGKTSDQIIGKSVYETAPAHLAQIYADADQFLLNAKGIQTYETSVAYADGSQHEVIFYKATFLNRQGNIGGLAGAILDISDRKQAEFALQNSLSQLALANDEIKLLNQQLESENLRMGVELSVVRKLQQMVLPKEHEFDQIDELEIAGFMEPADEVGGDYYDVIPHNGHIKVAIGDVTGHGLESGMMMIMVQTAVRTLLANQAANQELDPRRFLNTINRVIYDNAQRMNSDKNLSFALLDYQAGRVKLSGQHEEILVVRADGQIERIDTLKLGFFLGLLPNISEFVSQAEVQLQSGDGIVLYTDGITEAENTSKEYYGIDRLCQVVSENWGASAAVIRQAIVSDVQSYIGNQKVYDDITLLVLKQK